MGSGAADADGLRQLAVGNHWQLDGTSWQRSATDLLNTGSRVTPSLAIQGNPCAQIGRMCACACKGTLRKHVAWAATQHTVSGGSSL